MSTSTIDPNNIDPTDDGTVFAAAVKTEFVNAKFDLEFHTTIDVGSGNTLTGTLASITGGTTNTAGGDYTHVGGGHTNVSGASNNYCVIVGGQDNTISGTRHYNSIGGGKTNTISDEYCVIGGGQNNSCAFQHQFIGGGQGNSIGGSGSLGVISGGNANNVNGGSSAICGGSGNDITASYGFIGGGLSNTVSGSYSIAGGRQSKAELTGQFVTSDSAAFDWSNTVDTTRTWLADQMNLRYAGGYYFISAYDGSGVPTAGVQCASGANAWSTLSDINKKDNFKDIDHVETVDKLRSIPVCNWQYKSDLETDKNYYGWMAQDFHKTFNFGGDPLSIDTQQNIGVLTSAVKGLIELVDELKTENEELRIRLDNL